MRNKSKEKQNGKNENGDRRSVPGKKRLKIK